MTQLMYSTSLRKWIVHFWLDAHTEINALVFKVHFIYHSLSRLKDAYIYFILIYFHWVGLVGWLVGWLAGWLAVIHTEYD